jgi:hypothetical protein
MAACRPFELSEAELPTARAGCSGEAAADRQLDSSSVAVHRQLSHASTVSRTCPGAQPPGSSALVGAPPSSVRRAV